MLHPIADFVAAEGFASRALDNFADDLFRLLFGERAVLCVAFCALDRKTDLQRFGTLVSGRLWRAVFAFFTFGRLDCDFGRLLKPLASRAGVAAYPVGRTSTGVLSETWHSHNIVTTIADFNDVVTCSFAMGNGIGSPR